MNKLSIQSHHRRRGTTSPPLPCIHPNPGPKVKAKRKASKQASPPNRKHKKSSESFSPDERDKIKQGLESGKSQEEIIREGYSKKAVARWAKRLFDTGDVETKSPGVAAKEEKELLDLSSEEETKPSKKKGFLQVSNVEKGFIITCFFRVQFRVRGNRKKTRSGSKDNRVLG